MGTIDHRHRLRRSRLSWHRTPVSQVNRSAAAVPPPPRTELAAAPPARTWPGRETRDQAERLNDQDLHVLLPRLPAVGRALLQCDGKHHRCWRPVCAVCARDYRPDPIAQLHALAQADPGPHQVATIYLALFPPGSLGRAELRRTREMFRKRLDRAGFKGAIVAGGIEVAWQAHHQRWLLHAQVLAIGVAAQAWDQLEAAWRKAGPRIPSGSYRCATPTSSSHTALSS
jgi:hypothetical protein